MTEAPLQTRSHTALIVISVTGENLLFIEDKPFLSKMSIILSQLVFYKHIFCLLKLLEARFVQGHSSDAHKESHWLKFSTGTGTDTI
jgi:hypothetical protein